MPEPRESSSFKPETVVDLDKDDSENIELKVDNAEAHLSEQFRKPGEIVGRHFEVISVLGGGGQSVVYKARHQMLDKVFAVKVMLPDRIPNEKTVRRFQQEAKAVSRLDHPGIVKVHEFDVDEAGQPYIVMDYVDGTPLSSMIEKNGCLSPDETFALISLAADALAEAHAKRIVHRDIKPSNIIVVRNADNSESVKIVDFGIAKINVQKGQTTNLTHTGEVFGSPSYMSPEQCLGKTVDHRTDIYSLGCVLYECLFGRPPFTGESFLEVLMAHVQQPVALDDERIGIPLKNVIERCLAKDPGSRYQSIAEFQTDLDKASKGIEVSGARQKQPLSGQPLWGKYLEERDVQEKRPEQTPGYNSNLIKVFCVLFIPPIVGIVIWATSQIITNQGSTTVPHESGGGGGYGGATAADFLQKNQVPPHTANPLTKWSTDYQKADRYDHDTMQLFTSGQYEKAIDELKFCTATYKEGGTHYGNPEIETAYLGEANYHLFQCYMALGQKDAAVASLREAVRLLGEIKLSDHWMPDVVIDYANVLRSLGKTDEAAQLQAEYNGTGRIEKLP